jgi:uncharacterized membrane protein
MNSFWEYLKNNKGLYIGISVGLVVGILILTINFWRTLLLAICIGVGALFGNPSIRERLFRLLDRILPKDFK